MKRILLYCILIASAVASGQTISTVQADIDSPQVSVAYTETIATTGGTSPRTVWLRDARKLPDGLHLERSGNNALITGTPTKTGSWTCNFMVKDSSGLWSAKTLTFGVKAAPLPPDAPSLTAPPDGRDPFPIDSTLVWASSSGATEYHLQVDSVSNSFGAMRYNDSTKSTTTQALTGMSNSKTYYWRVRAGNTVGWSSWTSTRSFTTAAAAGGALTFRDSVSSTVGYYDSISVLIDVSDYSDRRAFVFVARDKRGTPNRFTFAGSSMTLLDSISSSNDAQKILVYSYVPSVGNSQRVTVGWSDPTNGGISMAVYVYSGASTEALSTARGTTLWGTTATTSSISSATDEIIIDAANMGTSTSATATGQTFLTQRAYFSTSYKTGSSSTTMARSQTGDGTQVIVAVSVKPK